MTLWLLTTITCNWSLSTVVHHQQQQQFGQRCQHDVTVSDNTTTTTTTTVGLAVGPHRAPRGLDCTDSASCSRNLSPTDCNYHSTVATGLNYRHQQCTEDLTPLDSNRGQYYCTGTRPTTIPAATVASHVSNSQPTLAAAAAHAADTAVSQLASVSHLQVTTTRPTQQQQQQTAFFDPYLQDDDGDSLLHLAILVEDRDKAEQLANTIISCATSVDELNLQNRDYQTALHLAVITDQPNTVRRLMQCSVDVSCQERCHGDTALHLACRLNRLDCFIVLLQHTTTTQQQQLAHSYNYQGETCLHVAAKQPEKHLFHHLITQCSLDVNVFELCHGRTVLHAAVDRNDLQVVQMLLEHSFLEMNQSTYDGLTALNFARSRRLVEMERLLLSAGALATQIQSDSDDDINVSDNETKLNCSTKLDCENIGDQLVPPVTNH